MKPGGPSTFFLILTAAFVLGFALGLTVISDLLPPWGAGIDGAATRPASGAAALYPPIRRS